jgi:HD-like signal output (HDOD) protein
VNSSYFGFAREISSVQQAITLVGVRTIKNFALWSAVFSLMPNPKSGPVDLKKLWQDSLHRGLFARTLGKHLGLRNQEDLFAAALLQDMAIPLLAKELPDQYAVLLADRDGGRRRLSDLERERFGWTHADAAGVIARTWSLPEEFALLIEAHPLLDQFLTDPSTDPSKLVVSLSSALPSMHDETWNEYERFESAYAKIAGADPTVPDMLARIDRDFEDFAPVLKIAGSDRSLQDSYNEATTLGV